MLWPLRLGSWHFTNICRLITPTMNKTLRVPETLLILRSIQNTEPAPQALAGTCVKMYTPVGPAGRDTGISHELNGTVLNGTVQM